MKRELLLHTFILLFFSSFLVSCDLLQSDKNPTKELTAEEAKVEIRAANQEMAAQVDQMIATPAMGSLNHLANLSMDMKSAKVSKSALFVSKLTYSSALNHFRDAGKPYKSLKMDDDDDEYYGIFEFNFDYDEMEMVQESSTIFQVNYPADEVAYANRQNNAQMTISNLDFQEVKSYYEDYDYYTESWIEVETTDLLPVSANVIIKIDGKTELDASYNASYTADGLPLSVSASMETAEYKMTMSYSGSSTKYNTKMSYKLDKEEIMAYDLDVTYSSNQEDVEHIKGYYLFAPLKINGEMYPAAIETHTENNNPPDLTYLNSQMDIDMIHLEKKAIIGHLEFFMYYDAEWEESSPMPAIVYEDGTYEWLTDVMTFIEF